MSCVFHKGSFIELFACENLFPCLIIHLHMIPFLKPGDKVRICSPAKQIDEDLISFAKALWEKEGFQVEISPNALGRHHYFSGTIDERKSDFQQALDDPSVKAIVCSRGGYGAIQLLDHLDWTLFRENPKWILGFSDITNFHLELATMILPGIHTTMPLNYQVNSEKTLSSMFQAIQGQRYTIEAPHDVLNQIGHVTGEIIGGNLSIVYSLLSRHNSQVFENKILYIEDVGEQLYHFDRMLYALHFSGILLKISGLVVGSFTDVKDTELGFGKRIQEIISNQVCTRNIPVGFNFPAGHQNDNQAIIMGMSCYFEVTEDGSQLVFNS